LHILFKGIFFKTVNKLTYIKLEFHNANEYLKDEEKENMSTFTGKIDILSRLTVKLAYLNLLWLLFCVLGGFVFGWAPATVSLFTILKKWTEKKDLRIFRTFFYTFKNEFIKSNVSGLSIECLALIFLVNLYTLFQQTNTYSVVFLIGNGTMIIMLMLLLMFFFPIYIGRASCRG